MPRIEFNHPEIEKWWEETQHSTSTFDLCRECFGWAKTALELNLDGVGDNGDPIPEDATFAEVDGLWDFDCLDYTCDSCQKPLNAGNY